MANSALQVPILVALLLGHTPVLAGPTFGEGGLQVGAIQVSSSSDGEIRSSVVVVNKSGSTARVFLNNEPGAIDNRGHSFSANINNGVFGVYVCPSIRCEVDYKNEVERSSTIIEKERQIYLILSFYGRQNISETDPIGDTVDLSFVLHAQPVEETADGFASGPWRTFSLGLTNIPVTNRRK